MFSIQLLYYFPFYLTTIIASIHINMDRTHVICDNGPTDRFHCFHVPLIQENRHNPSEIITYCRTECSNKVFNQRKISPTDYPSLTFEQLAQQNITSQQLYFFWSAPIGLAERYQQYLDQPHHSQWMRKEVNDVFYNCTWPRFGPSCEYSFAHLSSSTADSFSSLNELIQDYYHPYRHKGRTLTCYEYLQCDRGPSPFCLDWSEICDGKIDCRDGGRDEEHCWQLEVNECAEDEFRCDNGQCIPMMFFGDYPELPDCLDGSDEPLRFADTYYNVNTPTIYHEDTSCSSSNFQNVEYLTSSCSEDRRIIYTDTILSAKPHDLSDDCWQAFLCIIQYRWLPHMDCSDYCKDGFCKRTIRDNCSTSLFFLSNVPVLYGHLNFAFSKHDLLHARVPQFPEYTCMRADVCHDLIDDDHPLHIGNITCYHSDKIPEFDFQKALLSLPLKYLSGPLLRIQTCASLDSTYFDFCRQHPNMYRCMNTSKCISKHRLLDGFYDCYFGDDEMVEFVRNLTDLNDNKAFFKCSADKYISSRYVDNSICNCMQEEDGTCADEYSEKKYAKTHISFQTQCDGFTELEPIVIDGKSMTDETDCQEWLCDNVYTRCDKIWNCWDGRDEVNCNRSSPIDCPPNARLCTSIETDKWSCLPVEKVNDGHIDCVGAMDERKVCRNFSEYYKTDWFHCGNATEFTCIPFGVVCNGNTECVQGGDDERICTEDERKTFHEYVQENIQYNDKLSIVHFSLTDSKTRNEQSSYIHHASSSITKRTDDSSSLFENQCHRGLSLRYWSDSSDSNITTITCVCPHSYYGQYCQYQNQRVIVTLQFRALSDAWQTTFIIVALLIDNTHQRHIHSAHQLTYLPFTDCQNKFNFYLLFSSRPKNVSHNYSVHFDIFEQHSHQHRASYLAPIVFPFLPVYRLALQLEIPRLRTQQLCRNLDCGKHGRCVRYARVFHAPSPSMTRFCQCDEGWSGRLCTIPIKCSCSPQARCLGKLFKSNRSICLCPSDKFGPHCYLSNDHICQGNSTHPACQNRGRCIPHDQSQLPLHPGFTCLCPLGFTGDRCEQQQTQLIISFDPDLVDQLSQSMLVHFIRSYPNRRHENSTTFKLIPFDFSAVSLFWSHPFHLMFIEFHRHQYYLAFIRPVFNQSEVKMETMIRSSDRCPHIRELVSSKMMQSHHLYRIKFYHQLCQFNNTMQQISCFYDDVHLCLCQSSPRNGDKREANCLEYDHGRKFDCLGQNACENGGQCFQDDSTCPRTSMCICAECTYGRRCQFTMNGFRLSLDAILGYHILPDVSISRQPSIVHLALSFTLVITVIGIINGFFVLITFKNKTLLQVGCGFYLLSSSMTTLSTMVLFLIKFIILLTTQMRLLTNLSFLNVHCRLIDYVLRVCLNLDQWLSACVSWERAVTTVQGLTFDKTKSRKRAKCVILLLLVMVCGSFAYDPWYHDMMNEKNDEEEDRIWCVASYSPWLRTFDSGMNMIHFSIPFSINIISALIITWQSAQTRRKAQTIFSFRKMLGEKLRQHKHILIAPLVIVVLGVPRLILAIVSGCMKSNRESRLYLAGYFISYAPVMFSFVIFVLPSKLYKKEFQQKLVQYRNLTRLPFEIARRIVSARMSASLNTLLI